MMHNIISKIFPVNFTLQNFFFVFTHKGLKQVFCTQYSLLCATRCNTITLLPYFERKIIFKNTKQFCAHFTVTSFYFSCLISDPSSMKLEQGVLLLKAGPSQDYKQMVNGSIVDYQGKVLSPGECMLWIYPAPQKYICSKNYQYSYKKITISVLPISMFLQNIVLRKLLYPYYESLIR